MEYHKVSKDDVFLRTAMWESYDKKCVYCGLAVPPKLAEIDHILPMATSKLENSNDQDLKEYLQELKEKNFEMNSVENYILCCSNCNKRKNAFAFSVSNFRYFHELAFRHAENVWKRREQNIQNVILDNDIETNTIKVVPQRYNEEELFTDCKIVNAGFKIAFCYGLGEIRVDAFLPTRYDDSLCCILYFKQLYQMDMDITFDENDIINTLFDGCDTNRNPFRRKWCAVMLSLSGDEFYEMHLPNIRLKTSAEAIVQFATILDKLFEEYVLQQENIRNIIGAVNFPDYKEEKGSYKIISINRNICNMFLMFIENHAYNDINKPYNIFHPLFYSGKVALQRNINSHDNAEVYAYLKLIPLDDNYVDIIWQPGIYGVESESQKMKNFDNRKKWTAQYVHDWLLMEVFEVMFKEENNKKSSFLDYLFRKDRLRQQYTVTNTIERGLIKSYLKEGVLEFV